MYEIVSSTLAVTTSFNKQSRNLLLSKSLMGRKTSLSVDDFKTTPKIVNNLTLTYMIERRTKDLYYFCDEYFSQTRSWKPHHWITEQELLQMDYSSHSYRFQPHCIRKIDPSLTHLPIQSKAKEFINTKGKQITITTSTSSLEYLLFAV